ncbi:hypothetical protein [Streptomyces sp. NBC_01643]|uniref:hypothetical protein n=1 Tax=Streptomyces sp. NBC_01643 TaxID=2975906 RepID=UPI003868AC20|nr:hypothetical protein OHB03_19785 [Streptomyces sp. NBC_01643]
MATLEAARAAKRTLAQRLADDPRVNGVGLGGTRDAYVLMVQLVSADEEPDLPPDVDGVPVESVVVGQIGPVRAGG